MGQAKQRGTYEQRKSEAIERNITQAMLNVEAIQCRPSPKLMVLMAMAQGITGSIPVHALKSKNSA